IFALLAGCPCNYDQMRIPVTPKRPVEKCHDALLRTAVFYCAIVQNRRCSDCPHEQMTQWNRAASILRVLEKEPRLLLGQGVPILPKNHVECHSAYGTSKGTSHNLIVMLHTGHEP